MPRRRPILSRAPLQPTLCQSMPHHFLPFPTFHHPSPLVLNIRVAAAAARASEINKRFFHQPAPVAVLL